MNRHWLRHRWWQQVSVDDMGLVHPCECAWWRRLWYLVTGR